MLLLLLLMSMLVGTGCTIGIKQETRLTMHDPIPIPESAKGAVRINTNEDIPLIIEGVNNQEFEKDIGGYVVVTPGWYGELIKNWNKTHSR
jgi:hypothetical protein